MSNNLEDRAARYFGAERDPRVSIKTTRWKCLLVVERGSHTVLCVYDEEGREPTGSYNLLTAHQRELLVGALSRDLAGVVA